MNSVSFAQDESGNWGYKIGGADSVIPFKSGGTGNCIAVFLVVNGTWDSAWPHPCVAYNEKYCTMKNNIITFTKSGTFRIVKQGNGALLINNQISSISISNLYPSQLSINKGDTLFIATGAQGGYIAGLHVVYEVL